MVATGQKKGEKIKILQGQGLVREFNFKSGKLHIFWISQGKAKFPGNMNDFLLSWPTSWWEMVPLFYAVMQLLFRTIDKLLLVCEWNHTLSFYSVFIIFSSFSQILWYISWMRKVWISRILLNEIGWQTKTNIVFPKNLSFFHVT